jgi:hypothetical protein
VALPRMLEQIEANLADAEVPIPTTAYPRSKWHEK